MQTEKLIYAKKGGPRSKRERRKGSGRAKAGGGMFSQNPARAGSGTNTYSNGSTSTLVIVQKGQDFCPGNSGLEFLPSRSGADLGVVPWQQERTDAAETVQERSGAEAAERLAQMEGARPRPLATARKTTQAMAVHRCQSGAHLCCVLFFEIALDKGNFRGPAYAVKTSPSENTANQDKRS